MATELFGPFKRRDVPRVGVGTGTGIGITHAVVAWLARPATDPPMINTGSSQ